MAFNPITGPTNPKPTEAELRPEYRPVNYTPGYTGNVNPISSAGNVGQLQNQQAANTAADASAKAAKDAETIQRNKDLWLPKITAAGLDPASFNPLTGMYTPKPTVDHNGKPVTLPPVPVEQAVTQGQAGVDQTNATNAAKAATTGSETALNMYATTPEQAAQVNQAAGKDVTGYRPPTSNYAAPKAAPSSAPKLAYGAFGLSNAEIDAFNAKMAPAPTAAPAGAPPGAGDAKPVGAPAPAPASAPAAPATTYAAPVQPQAPTPATPVAQLTQPQPAPVPSLQDLAHGLLAKMQSRPR